MSRPTRANPTPANARLSTGREGAAQQRKAAVGTVTAALVDEAKPLEGNPAQAPDAGAAVARARKPAEVWLAENCDALESSNAFVKAHGLPLAKYRVF